MDRVVPSYTPTVRSLVRAAAEQSEELDESVEPGAGARRMLVVTMSQTPGQPPLPNARRERDCLAALVPGDRLTVLVDSAATRAGILTAIECHDWLHLSCHGMQDLLQPSRGLRQRGRRLG